MSASSKKKLRKEQEAAAMTEKQLAQQKEDKKLKIATISFVAIMALVVCIAVGTLLYRAYDQSGLPEQNTVAMTIGDRKLTSAELNYFYMESISNQYNNWYSQYGSYMSMYLSMYGLDLSMPLNSQYMDEAKSYTWANYFADMAVSSAVSAYGQYDKAMADANFKLSDELQATLDKLPETLKEEAKSNKYSNVKDYLVAMYGPGSTEETYINFVKVMSISNAYAENYYNSLEYTADQKAAHDAEHALDYNTYSYAYTYLNATNYRQGGTKGEDGKVTYSDAEIAAAVEAAKADADLLATATDLAAFDSMIKGLEINAEKEAAESTKNNGTFVSQVNSLYKEWLTDSSRKAGDIGVFASTSSTKDAEGNTVTNTDGYYVVFFNECNKNEMNLINVRHILLEHKPAEGSTTITDADKMVTEQKANDLLQKWKDGEATEESFAALVKDNTADGGSKENGGLYENVYPGMMVTNFNDWCFAEGRKAGDTGVVLSDFGYHIMYFVGEVDQTYRDYMITNVMKSDDLDKWAKETYDAVKYEVLNISRLNLDLVLAPNAF